MNILVDENIPLKTVRELCVLGHDVMDIRKTDLEGLSDEALWKLVLDEKRLFITTDKGFLRYRYDSHNGILIIRLKYPNRERIHQRIMKSITYFSPEEWKRKLVVVRDTVQSIWKPQ